MTMATCALNQPCQRLRSKRWLGFDLVAAEPEWHKEVCLAPVEEQTPTLPPPSFLAEELLEREPTTANARQLYLVTCQHSAAWMLLTGSLACFAQVSGAMKMWQGSSWMLLTIQRHRTTVHPGAWQCNWSASSFSGSGTLLAREKKQGHFIGASLSKPTPTSASPPSSTRFTCDMGLLATGAALTQGTGLRSGIISCMPSPSKPREALDSEPYIWARHGEHKPLFETCQEPMLNIRREAKVMLAEELGKPEPRPTEMEFYPIIVKDGFRNSADDHTAAEKLIRRQAQEQEQEPEQEQEQEQEPYLVRGSYLEIYNEEIRDLLSKNPKGRNLVLRKKLTEERRHDAKRMPS
eukprot:s2926_g10.t1